MKIVGLDELLNMPNDTLFSFYKPEIIEGLMVFNGKSGNEDFFYFDLVASVRLDLSESRIDGGVIAQRWGLYDEDAQFVVYDKQSIAYRIYLLKKAFDVS